MTGCRDLESYLARLREGEAKAAFERHLESGRACRDEVSRATALDSALAAWLAGRPHPRASEAAAARLVRAAGRGRSRASAWAWATAGLAAVTVVAWLLVRTWTPFSRPPGAGAGAAPSGLDAGPEVAHRPAATPDAGAPPPVTVLLAQGGALREAGPTAARTLEVPDAGKLVVQAGEDRIGLGARSRAEVELPAPGRTRVRLLAGRVAVAAAPRRGGGTLVVEAGGHTVTVIGTRFSVAWDRRRLEVAVGEGRVQVEGTDGRPRRVAAGQRLRLDVGATADATAEPLPPTEAEALEQALIPTPAGSPTPLQPARDGGVPVDVRRPVPPPPPDEATLRSWLVAGETARAEQALLSRLAAAPADTASWWLLGEARRRAGRSREALEAYRRVLDLGAPAEANRGRYQAALLLAERLGDPAAAIGLLRAYLARAPRPLAAAASLRLGRLLLARGDRPGGRQVLQALVRSHPATPEAMEAKRLLATP